MFATTTESSSSAATAPGAASVGEQHEGEEAGYFCVVAELMMYGAGEADGFARKVDALKGRAGAGGAASVAAANGCVSP
jgi:hypothetical protein